MLSPPEKLRISQMRKQKGYKAERYKFIEDGELGAFYVLILAFVFIEFSSTVMVADSNKVTHSIKCTIYGNISTVPKKKKKKEKN